MASDTESTDYQGDVFEDAPGSPKGDKLTITPSPSTRSLTDRRQSNGSVTTPRAAERPGLPDGPSKSPGSDKGGDLDDEDIGSPAHSEVDETPRKQKSQKSPLLTAHRLSTSSLDEVNLAGPKEDGDRTDTRALSETSASPPSVPYKEPKSASRLGSFSASLPWGAPPANKKEPSPPPAHPGPPPRKLTSPFTWLQRSSTKDVKSPPATGANRRNTGASVSTLSSNPEMTLGRLQEGQEGQRNSLKDQFKLLRMREEASLAPVDDRASVTSGASIGLGLASPTSNMSEKEGGLAVSPLPTPLPTSPGIPSTINPDLPPGTVAGFSASATDASIPVDWELWQQIIDHGPQALTGANADELNAAIKRGIPQTIRGVIWQVLADSRNPELEEVYRELVTRGTDKEKERHSTLVTTNGSTNGSVKEKEKESLASSRSSMRSDRSSPASNTAITSPASFQDKDPEAVAKAQAALEAVRKKKAKEDAATLQKLEKVIRRDLGSRTSYSKYFLSQKNQDGLFGLCKAYALYDEAVGYAQGMNFIVMPLLFNLDEGEAFTLLVKLMNQYGLRQMFIQDMPGLHLHLYQFERLLEDLEPALACHLHRRGVPPQLYATQWFLTLFAYRFPLQLVLRIYDMIFEEGIEKTILKFGVAIMQRNAASLLAMNDMTALTTFLKEKLFDVYIDQQPSASSILESGFFGSSGGSEKEVYRADIMVQDASAINLTPEMLKAYTGEWEEKTRIEKERETELETLRHTTAVQASRIRLLEESAEKSDTEHVQLASELVRVKVENEELNDMNESMKVQIHELKIVVDKQPAEVEEKLRTEMDRIMKRNLEVQNENRAMEEQMTEMEKDLVEAKMRWAEISENHDNLKQKWSDLRKALD